MATDNFQDGRHALATGMILGALMKAGFEEVVPFLDSKNDYTNQMLVRIDGETYTITVDPAIAEALGKK